MRGLMYCAYEWNVSSEPLVYILLQTTHFLVIVVIKKIITRIEKSEI